MKPFWVVSDSVDGREAPTLGRLNADSNDDELFLDFLVRSLVSFLESSELLASLDSFDDVSVSASSLDLRSASNKSTRSLHCLSMSLKLSLNAFSVSVRGLKSTGAFALYQ
jgi:hypothetical protein